MEIVVEVSGGVVISIYKDKDAMNADIDITLVDHDVYKDEEDRQMEAKAHILNSKIIRGLLHRIEPD